MKQEMMG